MKSNTLFVLLFIAFFWSCKNSAEKTTEEPVDSNQEMAIEQAAPQIDIHPISHATMVLEWDEIVMYVDPVGGAEAFSGMKDADIILITDIHGDHLNIETLLAIKKNKSRIIAPRAVIDQLPEELKTDVIALSNGSSVNQQAFTITGIPMYNLREEALKYHEKGRGNGYLIQRDDYRVYISGDTEDIPEMRSLKNIDLAFVCMNLPYTMTVESAASAVAEFKPNTVIPYHFRGADGFADVDAFERLVNENAPEVEVKRLDFYPNK
ncbi:MBL fold metallo-hydrolase [uncultured Planktosalinus sp.]|uniref:MBL fold metallo-hydrolase n=1 Tax=uncultured Planktosalinus sp. TaxID=1810935 RepID=UPI0030DC0C10